ncbi:MAG TPA: contractile injection system protein, VgrG/Pvc8 family, partial [Minicystis sp.]|nr:contractile injection system protein, VgrG/Pvc8 family [Minicystis sp.]
MSRSITLAIEGRRAPLPVTAVTGREALSALFELTATLAGDADEAAAAIEIGARATLFVAHGPRTRTIHGIVKAFEQGDAGAPHGRVALVPAAYVLALREDCRVFSGRRAPEIVEAVLAAAGLEPDDYRFALRGDYGVREHCIQYRENDWTFLSRLLASEGIHCFFEHGDARAVLVFADAPGAHADMAAPSTLPFRPGGGALET